MILALWLWPAVALGATCEGGRPIRVLTLNAWGLPAPLARDRRGRFPRIERMLDEKRYDVVGLQEVWRGARSLLLRPMHTGELRGDSGLGIRSPYPVRHLRTKVFTAERGFDAFKAKGVLLAEVALPQGSLNVAVTHLQSGAGPKNAAVRRDQLAEILDALDSDGPWVLMGDFNFYDAEPEDSASHQRLRDAGFVDVGLRGGAKRGTYPGVDDRFDRVYVRSLCGVEADARVVEGTGLSDHHFVAVQWAWRCAAGGCAAP